KMALRARALGLSLARCVVSRARGVGFLSVWGPPGGVVVGVGGGGVAAVLWPAALWLRGAAAPRAPPFRAAGGVGASLWGVRRRRWRALRQRPWRRAPREAGGRGCRARRLPGRRGWRARAAAPRRRRLRWRARRARRRRWRRGVLRRPSRRRAAPARDRRQPR